MATADSPYAVLAVEPLPVEGFYRREADAPRYDIADAFRQSFIAGLEEVDQAPAAEPAQVLSFGFKSAVSAGGALV